MKKNKKLIIVSVIASLIFGLIIYGLFNPKYYTLQVDTGSNYNFADGILVANFWKGSFYLNVNFDNPNEYCTVGLFIYEKNTDELKLLESTSRFSDTGECQAVQTPSGYSITNRTFMRREKSFHNGNIVNQMVKNKENTYLCISKNESLTIEDCYKVKFKKY